MTMADDNVMPWRTPPLAASGGDAVLEQAYAEELAALRASAREEGLAQGREEAAAELKSQAQARFATLDALLSALQRPFEDIDDDVVEELARLAGHIAKQLLRREMQTSPESIVGVVREAISSLPDDREGAKVYLNHDDVQLVKEVSQMANQERSWELLSDPAVPRGDCVVVRGASLVDASLEARAQAAILQVLGGARAEDNEQ